MFPDAYHPLALSVLHIGCSGPLSIFAVIAVCLLKCYNPRAGLCSPQFLLFSKLRVTQIWPWQATPESASRMPPFLLDRVLTPQWGFCWYVLVWPSATPCSTFSPPLSFPNLLGPPHQPPFSNMVPVYNCVLLIMPFPFLGINGLTDWKTFIHLARSTVTFSFLGDPIEPCIHHRTTLWMEIICGHQISTGFSWSFEF